MIHDSG